MATRLAIFSDIHANFPAMGEVASHIREGDYDGVYCLGDLGGYASQPNEVQELVQYLDCPTVLGNYDEGVGFNKDSCGCNYVKPFDIKMSDVSFFWTRDHTTDEHKAWLRELPREIRLDVEGRRVLLCHGSPASTTEYLFETRSEPYLRKFTPGGRDDAHADIIVFGPHPRPVPPRRRRGTFCQHGQRGQAQGRGPEGGVLHPDHRRRPGDDRASAFAL